MALTKREFFDWLTTTRPPREITVNRPYDWCTTRWGVSCSLPALGRFQGKTLSEPHNSASAEQHRSKYQRWLDEFEAEIRP